MILIDPKLESSSITKYVCVGCVLNYILTYTNKFVIRKRDRNMEPEKMGFCEDHPFMALATHELTYLN